MGRGGEGIQKKKVTAHISGSSHEICAIVNQLLAPPNFRNRKARKGGKKGPRRSPEEIQEPPNNRIIAVGSLVRWGTSHQPSTSYGRRLAASP